MVQLLQDDHGKRLGKVTHDHLVRLFDARSPSRSKLIHQPFLSAWASKEECQASEQ